MLFPISGLAGTSGEKPGTPPEGLGACVERLCESQA